MAENLYRCGACAANEQLTPKDAYCRAAGDHPAVRCPRCSGRADLVLKNLDIIHLIRQTPGGPLVSPMGRGHFAVACSPEIKAWGLVQVTDVAAVSNCPACRAADAPDHGDGLPNVDVKPGGIAP